jgi:hypothetical protein
MFKCLKISVLTFFIIISSFAQENKRKKIPSNSILNDLYHYKGYFDFYYSETKDQIFLKVSSLEEEFLYVNSLSQGVGNNDLGLDRGQLGGRRVVFFRKVGDKLLLIQPNLKYIAKTKNILEKKSVTEAFAKSVLFGFSIIEKVNDSYIIDITPFLMEDRHGVGRKLKIKNQGDFKVDQKLSSIYLDRTKAFPKNIEFDIMLTLTGNAKGSLISSVTPSPNNLTVHQHHSFIELPDQDYKPRLFDPRSGANYVNVFDYATPVNERTLKQYITRHRLKKKDINKDYSESVEPIIYYLDNGTPEPIRSALIEGGSWWNEAFENIGFKDAFKIKILPKNADPLDVRYNVIQWVHRSTRGWSYGSSIVDPRTGEIIKGHVSLGSLRIRQDFMIALGLLKAPYSLSDNKEKIALEMALARIRQLSAHEIGHTLGFAHNFSASSNNRSSVMDYPHPKLQIVDAEISLDDAYAEKIGLWDKVSVAYSYRGFLNDNNEKIELTKILEKAKNEGHSFITDNDSRPVGGAHPRSHLWDNGSNPVEELKNIVKIRKIALGQISIDHIKNGEKYSRIEDIMVPIYLLHRYQAEAVVKLIGGVSYDYAVKGNVKYQYNEISSLKQREALQSYLDLIKADQLIFPESLRKFLLPRSYGSPKTRENFLSQTGVTFDFIGASNTLSDVLLQMLLNPQRSSRLIQQTGFDITQLSLDEVIESLFQITFKKRYTSPHHKQINEVVKHNILKNLFSLGQNSDAYSEVGAIIYTKLESLDRFLANQTNYDYLNYYRSQIQKYFDNPKEFKLPKSNRIPDGSPIGDYSCDF